MPRAHVRYRCGRGFSLVELLVVLGIGLILISIFVPYLLSVRERNSRQRCADNLRKIAVALTLYAQDNRGVFPRVVYDEDDQPHGYTAFSGPDAPDPFAAAAPDAPAAPDRVRPNDVSASLWLLLRGGYIPAGAASPTAVFVCPSSGGDPDELPVDQSGAADVRRRSNFRSRENLGYSYCSPFSNATRYGMTDHLPPGFVVMADRNPGIGHGHDVSGADYVAPPLQMAKANSANHGGAGQNVLYADMHVDFTHTPYCGMDGDNIYTAEAPAPVFTDQRPDPRARGFVGTDRGPAWDSDSYLVPAASDDFSTRRPTTRATTTTAPTTSAPTASPTTAPAPVAITPPQPAATTTSSALPASVPVPASAPTTQATQPTTMPTMAPVPTPSASTSPTTGAM